MDTSSNKLGRLLTRRYGHDKNHLKKETESLLITTQNNAIRNNYIQMKIDNAQQNRKCRLSRD